MAEILDSPIQIDMEISIQGKKMVDKKERKFDFWQDHSMRYLEMAYQQDKKGRLENPDGYGKRTGECGDTIEMFLTVVNGRIKEVIFDTDGCLNTNACANTVSLMAEGKTVDQAWNLTVDDVVDFLETLPSNEIHCAELAIGSLYLALSDYQKKQTTL